MYAPPIVEDFGGWYLRGDIGFSNQRVKSVTPRLLDPGISVASAGRGFDSAGIFGLGVGYRVNNWFRADVTGGSRGNANFHGLDIVSFNGVATAFTDEYRASKSEWLVLANAYVEPRYLVVRDAVHRRWRRWVAQYHFELHQRQYAQPGRRLNAGRSKWNFAWALHAGVGYKVSPNVTLELAYRYVDLGDGVTGALSDFTGFTRGRTMQFKDITSHDLKFGVRWDLSNPAVYAPPPLNRRLIAALTG